MSSLTAVRLGVQSPRVMVKPRGAVRSAGPDAAELAAVCGLLLDDWQQLVLDVAMGERSDDHWCASDVDLVASRQNGKNGCVEARELYGAVILGESIIHTAHLFKTTRESYNRLLELVEGDPDVRERLTWQVASPASGYEMRFRGGGRVQFIARSRTSGRGLTGDLLVFDEAQDLDDDAVGALLPTIVSRPNPQAWYLGSAPGPMSTVWHRRRASGREGGSDRRAFFEFSADPGCDLDDRDSWAQANPGLGLRLTEEAIEAERLSMSDEMFARERLSVSPDLAIAGMVIPPDAWASCLDPRSKFSGPPVFAVDVSPGEETASIAVAGVRDDGLLHVEIAENRPGTGWVAAWLKDRQGRWNARIVADPGGPAGAVLPDAKAAGVDIEPVSLRDHAAACASLRSAVVEGRMRHRGDALLDAALQGATKRDMGDGAWLWSRKSSLIDISPLVAATLALSAVSPAAPVFAY